MIANGNWLAHGSHACRTGAAVIGWTVVGALVGLGGGGWFGLLFGLLHGLLRADAGRIGGAFLGCALAGAATGGVLCAFCRWTGTFGAPHATEAIGAARDPGRPSANVLARPTDRRSTTRDKLNAATD